MKGQINRVYPCNGIVFCHKQEGNSDPCYNTVTLEDIILGETSQAQKDEHWVLLLTGGV